MSDKIYQFPSGESKVAERELASKQKHQLKTTDGSSFRLHLNGPKQRRSFWLTHVRGKRVLAWPGGCVELEALDPSEAASAGGGKIKPLKLTMPGKVLAVKIKEGDIVEAGAALVIVEAMKMENILMAPARAKVAKIHIKAGDRLESGSVLVSFSEA